MTATSRTSRRYLSAPHSRYALFLTQRLGGAIDSLYIMPVANSARSHRESIAREMRLFHGKTGPRSAHAGGAALRRSARRDATTPARRATTRICMCARCVYVAKGLIALCHRGISRVGGCGLYCVPHKLVRSRQGVFFFPDAR